MRAMGRELTWAGICIGSRGIDKPETIGTGVARLRVYGCKGCEKAEEERDKDRA